MKDRLRSWPAAVPGVHALSAYERAWLSKDVVAGLVWTALLVPQGMATRTCGSPTDRRLYASVLALFVLAHRALEGSRPGARLGPRPMIAATILPLISATRIPQRSRSRRCSLSWSAPYACGRAGELGFVADLLSMPTRIGYMNGLA